MDYHSDRFSDYSLLVFKKGKLIALLPANLNNNSLHSHQGLTYGGFVVLKELKFLDVLNAFQRVLRYLNEQKIKTLHIKLLPSIYTSVPSEEIDYIMFLLEATLTRRDLLTTIDVKNKLKYSRGRMEGYRRGVKNDLQVREVQDFTGFWGGLLIPNLEKKFGTKPVHNVQEITLLKKNFPKNIKQFNVYRDDVLVAGTTVFITKKVVHVQYIASSEGKNSLGSLDFLFHHVIENECGEKQFFDFGISNENQGKKVNEGLQFWKEGFGGRGIVQDFYEIKTEDYKKLNTVFV